ncbi:hypothetical protein PSCLAVI8L_80101 [Pseudoclavibacter sp. 8L]|nr:hypothetical protein PSCLAVI8L_80101 [Pseudoclavibacter sp. 8L]
MRCGDDQASAVSLVKQLLGKCQAWLGRRTENEDHISHTRGVPCRKKYGPDRDQQQKHERDHYEMRDATCLRLAVGRGFRLLHRCAPTSSEAPEENRVVASASR